jgi:hypothetical protein
MLGPKEYRNLLSYITGTVPYLPELFTLSAYIYGQVGSLLLAGKLPSPRVLSFSEPRSKEQ